MAQRRRQWSVKPRRINDHTMVRVHLLPLIIEDIDTQEVEEHYELYEISHKS